MLALSRPTPPPPVLFAISPKRTRSEDKSCNKRNCTTSKSCRHSVQERNAHGHEEKFVFQHVRKFNRKLIKKCSASKKRHIIIFVTTATRRDVKKCKIFIVFHSRFICRNNKIVAYATTPICGRSDRTHITSRIFDEKVALPAMWLTDVRWWQWLWWINDYYRLYINELPHLNVVSRFQVPISYVKKSKKSLRREFMLLLKRDKIISDHYFLPSLHHFFVVIQTIHCVIVIIIVDLMRCFIINFIGNIFLYCCHEQVHEKNDRSEQQLSILPFTRNFIDFVWKKQHTNTRRKGEKSIFTEYEPRTNKDKNNNKFIINNSKNNSKRTRSCCDRVTCNERTKWNMKDIFLPSHASVQGIELLIKFLLFLSISSYTCIINVTNSFVSSLSSQTQQQHPSLVVPPNDDQQKCRKMQDISYSSSSRTRTKSTKNFCTTFLLLFTCIPMIAGSSIHANVKYSTNIIKTKYGPLRGILVRTNPPVEAFLGVPYATPPVGSLRYMPPVTPSTWKNTRLTDRFAPVCPQLPPVPASGPEALLEVPRERLAQLRRLLPLLANQSEDCLYLNLYVPRQGDSAEPMDQPLATIVYIHGESYEWNSGNPYDGSVLALHGGVIVVTINFRLGVLGFLKTGAKGSAQGNFGLMDLVAGLHWLHENLPAFHGDPNRVTLMGHGTGAALANMLVVSPVAGDLVHRAILLSGSALSPWAIQRDPLYVKRKVAEHTGCHGELLEEDLAPCLRGKSVKELLGVRLDTPRFLPGFAPFVDGTVIVNPATTPIDPLTLPPGSAIASTQGLELADFPTRELIFGLTSLESYLDLSAQDLEFGFNETRRDRILRTYVRNVYHYHLNEIFSALKNEYTDWERPPRNPLSARDATLEFLSDGHTAAPLVRLGYMHSLRGGRTYFLHFRHQSGERDFPQRGGSVRGEDVPFCLGLPLSPLFPYNYTQQDVQTSRVFILYISQFAQTGNPNGLISSSNIDISHANNNNKHTNVIEQEHLLANLHSSVLHHYDENVHLAAIGRGSSNVAVNNNAGIGERQIMSSSSTSQPSNSKNKRRRETEKNNRPLVSEQSISANGITLSASINNHNNNVYHKLRRKRAPNTSPNNNNVENEIEEEADEELEPEDEDYEEEEDHDDEERSKTDRLDDISKLHIPFWDTYDSINQIYLEMGARAEARNHYRGHKLSMWLSLIPQLHSPGDTAEMNMRHHHFLEDSAQYYDGIVRQQSFTRPPVVKSPVPKITSTRAPIISSTMMTMTEVTPITAIPTATTECPPNTTIVPTIAATRPQHNNNGGSNNSNDNSLLKRLASTHLQSYATALTITIAVGCFLLLLNVFIFAAIYYQREKRANYTKRKEELTETDLINSSSSPSIERYQHKLITGQIGGGGGGSSCSRKSSMQSLAGANGFGEYEMHLKEKLCTVELPMQEFRCPSTSNSSGTQSIIQAHCATPQHQHNIIQHTNDSLVVYPPTYTSHPPSDNSDSIRNVLVEHCHQATQATNTDNNLIMSESDRDLSPGIPEPPPPPKGMPFQAGILRNQGGPSTPSTSKKRVQIQEISV
ncbi:uncharacterized protein LOC134829289 isoform X2 [Culicoides brevitarsis]|uniref:uncharacterized protein LOC134829289 isoform X2 n=1 Tax=Culicoides brevitarsis TaxID=469753 RepID=UPI00307CC2F1